MVLVDLVESFKDTNPGISLHGYGHLGLVRKGMEHLGLDRKGMGGSCVELRVGERGKGSFWERKRGGQNLGFRERGDLRELEVLDGDEIRGVC